MLNTDVSKIRSICRIECKIEIEVSAFTVWELISKPRHLEKVHPFLREHRCSEWSGVGSEDLLIYNSGLRLERTILYWIDGVGFNLDVQVEANGPHGENPVTPVEWRIKPLSKNRCRLTTRTVPGGMQGKRGLKAMNFFLFTIRPRFKSYWAAVLNGIKYHLETGETVKEDQFGRHPFFSA